MGSYDTVHAGTRCGQTKALGKGLRDLLIGDEVRCYPAAMTEEEYQLELRGATAPAADSFCVAMHAGGFLIVRDTVIEAWANEPAPDLPLFSSAGHPMTAEQAGDRHLWESEHTTCYTCREVRARGAEQVAADRERERLESAARYAARRAQRQREGQAMLSAVPALADVRPLRSTDAG